MRRAVRRFTSMKLDGVDRPERTVAAVVDVLAPALRKQGAEERDRELAARADNLPHLPPAVEEVLAALSDVDRQAARVVFLAAFNLQVEDVAKIAWAKGAEEERERLREIVLKAFNGPSPTRDHLLAALESR